MLLFETNHFISQTMYQPYQMSEVTPNTYKALQITSKYVSDPVFETNLAVSTLLKLCVNLQTMPGTIFIIG